MNARRLIPRSITTVPTITTTISTKNLENENSRTPHPAKSDHSHCVELVQTRDWEGYISGLLMPSHARESYFAVRAFNVEISSIKDAVSGREAPSLEFENTGRISLKVRMQWWREALNDMYENPAGMSDGAAMRQPVVRALSRAVHHSGLTRRFLERMLDAREADLDSEQVESVHELVQYGEDTVSSLNYLSLECAGVRDAAADDAASNIGVAQGIVTALRSTAHRATHGEISIPTDLMRKYAIPTTHLLRPKSLEDMNAQDKEIDERLRTAVAELANVARANLVQARQIQGGVPKGGKSCLLPAVGAAFYLNRLEEVGFNVVDSDLLVEGKSLGLTLQFGRAWLTGVF